MLVKSIDHVEQKFEKYASSMVQCADAGRLVGNDVVNFYKRASSRHKQAQYSCFLFFFTEKNKRKFVFFQKSKEEKNCRLESRQTKKTTFFFSLLLPPKFQISFAQQDYLPSQSFVFFFFRRRKNRSQEFLFFSFRACNQVESHLQSLSMSIWKEDFNEYESVAANFSDWKYEVNELRDKLKQAEQVSKFNQHPKCFFFSCPTLNNIFHSFREK